MRPYSDGVFLAELVAVLESRRGSREVVSTVTASGTSSLTLSGVTLAPRAAAACLKNINISLATLRAVPNFRSTCLWTAEALSKGVLHGPFTPSHDPCALACGRRRYDARALAWPHMPFSLPPPPPPTNPPTHPPNHPTTHPTTSNVRRRGGVMAAGHRPVEALRQQGSRPPRPLAV
jgi:hypothetical protein